MRLFAAVPIEIEDKMKIKRFADSVAESGVTGNYIDPVNYHVTLAYIGETDMPEIAFRTVSTFDFFKFTSTIDLFCNFDRTLWVGPEEHGLLYRLVRLTANKMCCAGFEIENRPIVPHITICKNAELPKRYREPFLLPFKLMVSKVSIMNSIDTGSGVKYEELFSIDLK